MGNGSGATDIRKGSIFDGPSCLPWPVTQAPDPWLPLGQADCVQVELHIGQKFRCEFGSFVEARVAPDKAFGEFDVEPLAGGAAVGGPASELSVTGGDIEQNSGVFAFVLELDLKAGH